MPQHGFSIGRDITLAITTPQGAVLNLGKVTAWDCKQDSTETKIKGLDGITDNMQFYDEGWTGTFTADRRDGDLDDLFISLQQNYQAGQDQQYFKILETVSEPDGSVSQFMFTRVTLKFTDAGSWEASKTVTRKVEFWAFERARLA